MNADQIRTGLAAVGAKLKTPITITVGGSAASVLRHEIGREANDCDLADIIPSTQDALVENIGNEIAAKNGLEPNWLNAECIAWQDDFPVGWRDRVEGFGVFGKLAVRVLSRPDTVSTRVLRLKNGDPTQDLTDIAEINLSLDEINLVRQHLDQLERAGYEMDTIRVALGFL